MGQIEISGIRKIPCVDKDNSLLSVLD